MKILVRIFNGQISGPTFVANDDSVVDPDCVPVVDDPVPVFSSSTHRIIHGPLVIRDGGSWVQRTWQVIAKDASEIADEADRLDVSQISAGLDNAIAKMENKTATAADREAYLLRVLKFIRRWINKNGIP